jgi:hypothetical protein
MEVSKSGLFCVTVVLGLLVVFGFSGCSTTSSGMSSSGGLTEADRMLLAKGVEPEHAIVCFWPIIYLESNVRPIVDRGEAVGVERERKTSVLLLFNSTRTKRENLP